MQGSNWSLNLNNELFRCPECDYFFEIKHPFQKVRCDNCKVLFDWTWLDNQYVEKAERAILENTFLELAIVQKMV